MEKERPSKCGFKIDVLININIELKILNAEGFYALMSLCGRLKSVIGNKARINLILVIIKS